MSGRRNHRKLGHSAIALAFSLAIGGCAAVIPNAPLHPTALNDESGPISKGGYRLEALPQKETAPDLLVLLCFSGGGKRSAAFGYGVLKGLRDFNLPGYGEHTALLDAVDVISAVSGGSFPAAYYGLYRDRIFTDFEKDFLTRDIDGYIWGSYLLPWNYRWMFDSSYGTNDRMAGIYDDLMFHGATYEDMQKKGRPLVSIDATDVDHGLAFPFIQDQFDLICSDLTTFPVARAVAASNGFPVLFSPITLESHRAACGNRVPYWLTNVAGNDPLSRAEQFANASRKYLDAAATRYVHLLDGGISDNLAMRGIVNIMMVLTHGNTLDKRFDLSRIRRILLISADGQAASIGQIFSAVSGTQIDSYNFETMILANREVQDLRDAIRRQRCNRGKTDNNLCDDVQSYVVHLSLAGVDDPETRKHLQAIPTGLDLEPDDVTRLVQAGEQQVRESTGLAQFQGSLTQMSQRQ